MNKLILSIMMISGTSLGGAMIALPATAGQYGYLSAVMLLAGIWAFNLFIAFLFVEANYHLPVGSNFITLSRQLLGKPGEVIAWGATLFFFYSLLTAYTAGTSEIIQQSLSTYAINISTFDITLMITALLAVILYFGFSFVAWLNQYIVIGLFGAFVVMAAILIPHSHLSALAEQKIVFSYHPIPVVFTSFGFLAILPSIRNYLNDDLGQLKKAIVIGSGLPLVIYLIWVTIVLGVLPSSASVSILKKIAQQSNMISIISHTLSTQVHSLWLTAVVQSFVFFAIGGSFLGTSIALFDCLYDGLGLKKISHGRLMNLLVIFIPIIVISAYQPGLFIHALKYAGLIATLLFAAYPVFMAISGRRFYSVTQQYKVCVSDGMLYITALAVFGLIALNLI